MTWYAYSEACHPHIQDTVFNGSAGFNHFPTPPYVAHDGIEPSALCSIAQRISINATWAIWWGRTGFEPA